MWLMSPTRRKVYAIRRYLQLDETDFRFPFEQARLLSQKFQWISINNYITVLIENDIFVERRWHFYSIIRNQKLWTARRWIRYKPSSSWSVKHKKAFSIWLLYLDLYLLVRTYTYMCSIANGIRISRLSKQDIRYRSNMNRDTSATSFTVVVIIQEFFFSLYSVCVEKAGAKKWAHTRNKANSIKQKINQYPRALYIPVYIPC